MDIAEFAVDPALYDNGKRVDFGEGAYMGIRSANSDFAQKVRARLWKPYESFREVSDEVKARINSDWVAQGLLTEFVGFTDGADPITFDPADDASKTALSAKLVQARFKAMRNKIIGLALDDAQFQAIADAVTEKN